MIANVPCIRIPDPANHKHFAWSCPVPGTHHWLEIRQIRYKGKVIWIRVIRLIP